ncbi:MAG: hypothetical protein COB25_007640 [Oceanospirillales bacterium]|nr:hypothetical protein [Oceanospirillales bacterium]
MIWKKKGIIYVPPGDDSWRDNSALTPTAFQLSDDVIRVFASFRDSVGVGRIGYVDVSADNPSDIVGVSNQPALDVGVRGMFDDNGVIMGDVLRVSDKVYLYYVGFQLVDKVKFLAYSGLAVSEDGGNTFIRNSNTPVLDRADEGLYIRAIHSVVHENGVFRVWYAVGNDWEVIGNCDFPQYDINYMESRDGMTFSGAGIKCIRNDRRNLEYRIGRPRVYRSDKGYVMNFTYGTLDGRYQAGQALSQDGHEWHRDDESLGLKPSSEGWDSTHLSYPSVIKTSKGRVFAFYNGNNMGKEGFGYAELVRP